MGVPHIILKVIKGVIMIISFGGKEYVSGESYTALDILAAYKQGLRNGEWEAEEKHKLEVVVEPQYHYEKGYEDGKSFGMNDTVFQKKWIDKERKNAYELGYHEGYKVCSDESADSYLSGYNQGCNDASEGFELRKDVLNKEYVKGKTDGYGEGYQHGFTLAKEKITQLDNKEFEGIIDDAFQEGYAQAYSELHAPTSERERQLQEKAWDEGYKEGEADMLETVNELSAQQAEDYNNGEISDTDDEQLEKELALVKKYPHYYKDVRHLNILDIYRFFDLFEVKDPCLQHSIKKQAVGGKRGLKDYKKDIKEAMDTLNRWEYMQEENERVQND